MSHFLDAEIIGLAGKTKPTRISFDRHVNIIYGLNGSGKTSLLKILHSAMEMDPTPLRNVPFTEATVRVHSLTYKLDFTLQVKKSDLKLPEEVEFRLPSLEMTCPLFLHQSKLEFPVLLTTLRRFLVERRLCLMHTDAT
jgi:hypothetical protein